MSLTLLLDLDDTLLDTNVTEFIPAYFGALSRQLAGWVKPEVMMPALMSGTSAMVANEDPELTLETVFDREFYPRVGVDKAQLRPAIEDFYDHEFPRLRGLTRQLAGAGELVEWALGRGYRVVVATDPLLPRKAILERIRWAGLDPDRFELISAYETFHFSKSHSAYYGEVLGLLGWPDGPILMVGNDQERDLRHAQAIGLRTYRVQAASPTLTIAAGQFVHAEDSIGGGGLGELRTWLEQADPSLLEPVYSSQDAALGILLSTPAALQGLTRGLSPEQWRHEPTENDWAMIELVSHLRDTEREVHLAQLDVLLRDPQPFVPRPDAAVWAKQRKYLDEDGDKALAAFADARKELLRRLQSAKPENWDRPARHAIFGPTDFREVIGFMADHDRLHIQQAWRTLHGG